MGEEVLVCGFPACSEPGFFVEEFSLVRPVVSEHVGDEVFVFRKISLSGLDPVVLFPVVVCPRFHCFPLVVVSVVADFLCYVSVFAVFVVKVAV